MGAGSDVTFDLSLLRDYGAGFASSIHCVSRRTGPVSDGGPIHGLPSTRSRSRRATGLWSDLAARTKGAGRLSADNLYRVGSSFVKAGRLRPVARRRRGFRRRPRPGPDQPCQPGQSDTVGDSPALRVLAAPAGGARGWAVASRAVSTYVRCGQTNRDVQAAALERIDRQLPSVRVRD